MRYRQGDVWLDDAIGLEGFVSWLGESRLRNLRIWQGFALTASVGTIRPRWSWKVVLSGAEDFCHAAALFAGGTITRRMAGYGLSAWVRSGWKESFFIILTPQESRIDLTYVCDANPPFRLRSSTGGLYDSAIVRAYRSTESQERVRHTHAGSTLPRRLCVSLRLREERRRALVSRIPSFGNFFLGRELLPAPLLRKSARFPLNYMEVQKGANERALKYPEIISFSTDQSTIFPERKISNVVL